MNLAHVIISPVVTEKSVRLQESNKHVFRIHPDATKIDVINAVRSFYGVTPSAVHVLKNPKKIRMVGRSKVFTKRKLSKRAVVTLGEGESIELVSVQKAPKKSVKKVSVSADEKKKSSES